MGDGGCGAEVYMLLLKIQSLRNWGNGQFDYEISMPCSSQPVKTNHLSHQAINTMDIYTYIWFCITQRLFNENGGQKKVSEFSNGGRFINSPKEGSFATKGDRVTKLGTNM